MSHDALEFLKLVEEHTHPDFKIEHQNNVYLLSDEDSGQVLSMCMKKVSDTICLVIDKKPFSITQNALARDQTFAFLKPGTTRKNDAILMAHRDERLIVFLIEMKTGNRGEYLKQMKNGRCFTQFLLELLVLNKQCKRVDPFFFGVLCFGSAPDMGRKSEDKETSRHGASIQFENQHGLPVCDWYESVLNVKDLLNAATRKLS